MTRIWFRICRMAASLAFVVGPSISSARSLVLGIWFFCVGTGCEITGVIRANDQIPILVKPDGNHRLNVQYVLRAIRWADVEVCTAFE
jgi:hypothetical protein